MGIYDRDERSYHWRIVNPRSDIIHKAFDVKNDLFTIHVGIHVNGK